MTLELYFVAAVPRAVITMIIYPFRNSQDKCIFDCPAQSSSHVRQIEDIERPSHDVPTASFLHRYLKIRSENQNQVCKRKHTARVTGGQKWL
jgi:hypothetical protein